MHVFNCLIELILPELEESRILVHQILHVEVPLHI